jgi:hypothetical protein
MSIPASRWWHMHWREWITVEEFTRNPRLWLLVDHIALTTSGEAPAVKGSTVALTTLSAVTGWDRKTVGQRIEAMERRGLLLVKRFDARSGRSGRPGHRYLLPPFLASEAVRGNDERGTPPNPSDGYGESAADDSPKPSEGYGENRGGYGENRAGYGESHAADSPGRVLKELKVGTADAAVPTPCPNHCKKHRAISCDTVPNCPWCSQQREANGGRSCAELAAERGDVDPVHQLAERVHAGRVKRHKPWEGGPPPARSESLRWAHELLAHEWCGECDELMRMRPNEYGGSSQCHVCRPPYDCRCATEGAA